MAEPGGPPGLDEASAAAEALIASPRVSPATRAVLQARLRPPPLSAPRFFEGTAFDALVAACESLLPPTSPVQAHEVALGIDARLASGQGDGWRYDSLPDDGTAYRRGLAGLNAEAAAGSAATFAALDASGRDAALKRAAAGQSAAGSGSDGFDTARWFEELLVEVSEAHVAHPAAQLQMGCTAFADLPPDEPFGFDRAPYRRLGAETAPLRRYGESEVVDAVVIGTGAGGGPLLWRLARAGCSVVALEAGRHWLPARDFATDEKAQAGLFWSDERLSAGADPLAFGNNNSGIGVGGSTLHFTAYTPRPQDDDFRLRSTSGAGVDWPLGYAELEPYFDELEALIGVSGPETYPWGPPRKSAYPLPPLPLNAAAKLMQRGCAELGIATSEAANAALSRDWAAPGRPLRHACTQRGFCQAGCTTGAKGSVDVVFIPPALSLGAELRPECFATRIERNASGAVTAVIYMQGGREKRQRCRNVFLCGGAIETPRLLLLNDGLANGSGQVGRNFMAHTGLQLWGFFDAATEPWRGIPGGLISEDMHRPSGPGIDFAGGYLLQSIGVMPVTYASQLARSGHAPFGRALGEHLARYDHVAGINILGECLPAGGNYLELSGERDGRGLAKPRIHFSAGANEQKLHDHAERTMRAIWQAAGARDSWAFRRYAHIMGTCRMGNDRESAVVDADGRAFDVPGLHISDNSIFPSALAANPALTLMALSLRIADRFLARRQAAAA